MSKLNFNNLKCKQSQRGSPSAALTVTSSYLRREHAVPRKPRSPYLRMASDDVSSQCWDFSPYPKRASFQGPSSPYQGYHSPRLVLFCSLILHMTEKEGVVLLHFVLCFRNNLFSLYRIMIRFSA